MELGRVLVLSLLWKGALCPSEDYTLTVTSPVRAQKGLCVLIPCTFTYEDTTESPGRAHGYWFIKDDPQDKAVATNDVNKQIYEKARDRFRLAGDVRSRDCSLSINDVRSWDKKNYFFRYEHSEASTFKWNYVGFPLRVTVLDLQDKPTIDLPPALTEGKNVSVNCTAPGRCSGTPPSISWTMSLNSAYSTMKRTINHSDGTQSHISEITFQVSREHNRKQLDCTAYFSTVSASATSSATLNVEYPPMTPTISISITDREGIMRTTNATSVEVLEGSNCSLFCTADSEPLSNLTWMKGGLILNESAFVSNNLQLIRLNISPKDDGIYHCAAANKHGREQSSVTVSIQYPPRNLKINTEGTMTQDCLGERENNCTEKILEGRSVTMKCSVESSPLANLTWKKVEDKILKNSESLGENSLTLSLPHVTPENDGQYLCEAQNKHGAVNSSLSITVEYKPRLADSSCQSEANSIRCTCVVEANPPPTIKWKINENTLPESFQNQSMALAFSLYRATKNATLVMNISNSASLSITCIFSNAHGALDRILQSPAEGSQSLFLAPMIGGGLAGIIVFGGIFLLGWLLVRRTKNGKNDRGKNEGMVDVDTLIYSEITKPPKSPIATEDRNHGVGNKPDTDATRTEPKDDMYENFGQDNLQYASIDFSKLKPKSQTTAYLEETLYSEVKLN
ncbi:hypothetical protein NDU88_010868 [Pleurodeles waltl]|uniref:Ig-like domain-containing protein n=1 Tax=Pleurodeles waltl TaxID=8319 RepID=A0AAV7Q058_PLEWA|nr:hypothetical protein NDU88_010868 [Pleurodeles waltl]